MDLAKGDGPPPAIYPCTLLVRALGMAVESPQRGTSEDLQRTARPDRERPKNYKKKFQTRPKRTVKSRYGLLGAE